MRVGGGLRCAGTAGVLPGAMNTIAVGDILDALPMSARKQVMRALKSKADDSAVAATLKGILNEHEAALGKIGLIPDYTAYLLLWKFARKQ